MSEITRIQIDIPTKKLNELDELMKEMDIATRKDLLNNAIALFVWAAKEKRKLRSIVSVDEDSGQAKELVMPPLERITEKAEANVG